MFFFHLPPNFRQVIEAYNVCPNLAKRCNQAHFPLLSILRSCSGGSLIFYIHFYQHNT